MANNLARKKISAAYRYSFSRLALNYDILYELISEDPELLADFGTVREEFDQIRDIILDIIPCHLETEFYFRYLTWAELEAQQMTWAMIHQAGHTWYTLELAV